MPALLAVRSVAVHCVDESSGPWWMWVLIVLGTLALLGAIVVATEYWFDNS